WEKGSPLHKSTQQVRTQGPIRHADCRQRKLADFLCTGGIIQGMIRRDSVASGNSVQTLAHPTGCDVSATSGRVLMIPFQTSSAERLPSPGTSSVS
ncbi:hypothetical protein C6X66_14675, partial [Escherichia coli]